MGYYHNPIICGYHPDPSCCKVGDTFYLVCSSFLAFPAIPIYASHDLLQWRQIGNVCTRDSQLDLTKQSVNIDGASSGVWAPTIRYHDGMFYVVTTRVDMLKEWEDITKFQNLIWTCKDPFTEEWSGAVEFDYPGFDTSLFWDDDGKCYLQGSEAGETIAKRQITQYEIDVKTGKQLGEKKQLWTGEGGIFPEAPHVFKNGKYYYLLTAEGGTYLEHSAMLARAPTVWGPYERCPHNPILRPPPREELIQTVGHADIFESEPGKWWAVALATRIIGNHSPMGRETVLISCDWSGEWPVFKQPVKEMSMSDNLPPLKKLSKVSAFEATESVDAFGHKNGKFQPQWIFVRNPVYANYEITSPTEIILKGTTQTLNSHEGATTFVARRQNNIKFTASVTMSFEPAEGSNEEAGFTVFLDAIRHFEAFVSGNGIGFRKTAMGSGGVESGVAKRSAPEVQESIAMQLIGGELTFKVVGVEDKFTFYVSTGGKEVEVGSGPPSELSYGFCGTLIGIYATGNGQAAKTPAKFSNFVYDSYFDDEE